MQCSVCNVNLMTGFLTANCSSRSLSNVPQDLDPKIEVKEWVVRRIDMVATRI